MTLAFAYPWVLLGLVPVAALAWLTLRRRDADAVVLSDTGAAAALPASWWARLSWLPGALGLAALALAVVALARPQERNAVRETTTEGIDIMLVLDVSTSMQAQDFSPNRFEAARVVADNFIAGRQSDRIGLVVFAAQAYTQAPLTLDYPFLRQMLRRVRMGLLEDGTAIGTALATAVARLRHSDAESKVVILLTDGQNNHGEVDPATAAELAEAIGVRVYAIGVGADEDALGIPQALRGLQAAGGVDEEALRGVADRTGGRYFRATNREALTEIYDAIGELERTTMEERTYVDVEERYLPFVLGAFACLLGAVVLGTTRLRRVP